MAEEEEKKIINADDLIAQFNTATDSSEGFASEELLKLAQHLGVNNLNTQNQDVAQATESLLNAPANQTTVKTAAGETQRSVASIKANYDDITNKIDKYLENKDNNYSISDKDREQLEQFKKDLKERKNKFSKKWKDDKDLMQLATTRARKSILQATASQVNLNPNANKEHKELYNKLLDATRINQHIFGMITHPNPNNNNLLTPLVLKEIQENLCTKTEKNTFQLKDNITDQDIAKFTRGLEESLKTLEEPKQVQKQKRSNVLFNVTKKLAEKYDLSKEYQNNILQLKNNLQSVEVNNTNEEKELEHSLTKAILDQQTIISKIDALAPRKFIPKFLGYGTKPDLDLKPDAFKIIAAKLEQKYPKAQKVEALSANTPAPTQEQENQQVGSPTEKKLLGALKLADKKIAQQTQEQSPKVELIKNPDNTEELLKQTAAVQQEFNKGLADLNEQARDELMQTQIKTSFQNGTEYELAKEFIDYIPGFEGGIKKTHQDLDKDLQSVISEQDVAVELLRITMQNTFSTPEQDSEKLNEALQNLAKDRETQRQKLQEFEKIMPQRSLPLNPAKNTQLISPRKDSFETIPLPPQNPENPGEILANNKLPTYTADTDLPDYRPRTPEQNPNYIKQIEEAINYASEKIEELKAKPDTKTKPTEKGSTISPPPHSPPVEGLKNSKGQGR